MTLIRATQALRKKVEPLRFASPVTHVYNPLRYAWRPHKRYLELYGRGPKEVVFLGMNPGPWGMAQTGVPFGEVAAVRGWLGITDKVDKPQNEHPKRPVEGFACTRSEVSGKRLWGWAKENFETPESFFSRFFIANYCPLSFMEEGGRNRTPDKLPSAERDPLLEVCDQALRALVECLEPRHVIGIGAYAEGRAKIALDGFDVSIGRILHPSPASPLANKGWGEKATRELEDQGISI